MKIFELIYQIERENAINQLFDEEVRKPTEEQIGARIIFNIITFAIVDDSTV